MRGDAVCCAGAKLERTLTVLLHNREELDDDLGRRADKHLALTLALGVDNAVKSVVLLTVMIKFATSATVSKYVSRLADAERTGNLRERKCEPWWAMYVIYWAGTGYVKSVGKGGGWWLAETCSAPVV